MHRPRHPAPWPREQLFLPGLPPVYAHRHGLSGTVREHSHEFAEVVLVLSGEGLQSSGHGQRRLRAHDLVLLPQGTWHGFRISGQLEIIDCCLGLEVFRRELAWTRTESSLATVVSALMPGPERAAEVQVIAVGAPAAARLSEAFLALHQAALPAQARAASLIASTLTVLDALAQALPATALTPGETARPRLVAGVLELLHGDLAHRWTLYELARRLEVDRSHLVRTFTRAMGSPPMAYLASRRAERAAELLESTTWTIGRIGRAVGWPHAHHCSRRFRDHHGVSPRHYRLRVRG